MNKNTKQLTDTDFDNMYTYNEDLISECFEEIYLLDVFND